VITLPGIAGWLVFSHWMDDGRRDGRVPPGPAIGRLVACWFEGNEPLCAWVWIACFFAFAERVTRRVGEGRGGGHQGWAGRHATARRRRR
jgi:hypothetical protein